MGSGVASRNSFQEMIALLIEVQQSLDRDSGLESLAQKYAYSAVGFKNHETFTRAFARAENEMCD
jgi:hypothetical protein